MIEIRTLLDMPNIIVLACFGVAIVLALIILGIYLFNKKKSKKIEVKREEAVVFEHSDDQFIAALGGNDNIVSYELKGRSRLILLLKDVNKVDKDKIKTFQVSRFLEMSEKFVLVGENLEPLVKILNNSKIN